MFDQNAPPNERANARVLGLIRGGTESLKTDSFDPWAMAHLLNMCYDMSYGVIEYVKYVF